MRRPAALGLVVGGLVVALALAFTLGPLASSDPDGLERVAIDRDFDDTATEHPNAESPLADYAVRGVDGRVSTGLAGAIGVAATFAVASGALLLIRHLRQPRPTTAAEQ